MYEYLETINLLLQSECTPFFWKNTTQYIDVVIQILAPEPFHVEKNK